MKIGIFYLSYNGDNAQKQPLVLRDGKVVWVRVEEVNAPSLLTALHLAKPLKGEMVMNAHPLESVR